MLQSGILNPHLLHLLARIRHTNTLVIADWAFPYWPEIETLDLSLTHGIPTVLDVLDLISPVFKIGMVWQADEFFQFNDASTVERFKRSVGVAEWMREPHLDLKKRIPSAIGLIRTGDATLYSNMIIESA